MQSDTRQLLRTGSFIFVTGAIATILMFVAFGGVTPHGPQTNAGWLALMLAMGCIPTGTLTLALGLAKLIGERHQR